MTPGEFLAAWYGYADRQRAKELADLRATRQHAYMILSAFCKHMPDSAAKLMPLPDDDDDNGEDTAELDYEAIRQSTLDMSEIFGN